jgi:hypothetical protein
VAVVGEFDGDERERRGAGTLPVRWRLVRDDEDVVTGFR